jgi:glycosyltransferase involved in cell wall biosynthesis
MPDRIGGTELYTETLSARQVQAGHDVSIFVPSAASTAWPGYSEEQGVRVYRCPVGVRGATNRFRSTFSDGKIDRAFAQVLAKEQPDVVHIQHLMGLPISVVDQLLDLKIPYVLTLHDYWYICANAQLLTNYDNTICEGPNWWINCARCALARMKVRRGDFLSPAIAPILSLRDRMVSKALRGAEQMIAPTTFVRDIYSGQGVDNDKIAVIPHGIDPPDAKYVRREPKANELKVGYIGGLSWQKGVHVLIQAFNQLPVAGSTLSIWGDPDAFPEYVERLLEMARHTGIELKGQLSRQSFWSTLAGYDVVVVPSLWYETASLIIQEAFSVGVPVVASNIGALAVRVNDDQDGLLVPPNDSRALSETLLRLMENPDLIKTLQSGIQPVYTIDEHAHDIDRVYDSATRS